MPVILTGMSTTTHDLRQTEYSPVVPTTDFPAVFPVFDNDDLKVVVNGVERNDFTVTATYAEGISNDAKAVFSVGVTGKVFVIGARDPRRTNRFGNGNGLPIWQQNLALDTLEAESQEQARDINRSHRAPYGEEGGVFSASEVGAAQGYAEQALQARDDTLEYRNDAIDAANDAQQAASSAQAELDSRAYAIASYHPLVAPNKIRVAGYYNPGDGGGFLAKKVNSPPSHAGWFPITLSDGVTVAYYEIAEVVLTERMFGAHCDGNWAGGGTDDTTLLQNWASCPVSNVKRFTGVSKATDRISFPIDTNLSGSGDAVGIDFSAATAITGFVCMLFDGSANLVQIANLSSGLSKGATSLTFASAPALVPGDRICIYNPTDHSWTAGNVAGSRSYYRAGEWCRVRSISGNTVLLDGPTWAGYTAANVNVYRLRGAGPKLQNFRVRPPYLQVSGITIDCAIMPFIQGVNRTEGSEYCGIELVRCLDIYVNNNQFQGDASGTPNDEYALCISNCTGGEIHGSYAAQRHGIAFGSGSYAAGVPCRSVRVFADTYSSLDVPSLDFGHGSTEGLQAIGGTHNGIGVGGKNHKFKGLRSRKGVLPSGVSGLTVNGTEIYGGTFEFEDCYLEQLASATASFASVYVAVQAAATEPIVFSFKDCTFDTDPSDTQCIRINATNSPVLISVDIDNPLIRRGTSLSRFLLLSNVSGTFTMPLLNCRGVKGLSNSIARVVTTGTITFSEVHMDPQSGASASVAGNTGASSVNQAVGYSWAYPAGVVPLVKCQLNSSNIGGKRAICFANSISNTGFQITAMTPDAANFASTAAGSVLWEATVD